MKTYFEIKSRQALTIAGEKDGSLAASLAAETTGDLQQAYRDEICSSDWSNPVFGANARRWSNLIARELLRRSISSFWHVDYFGRQTITVRVSNR